MIYLKLRTTTQARRTRTIKQRMKRSQAVKKKILPRRLKMPITLLIKRVMKPKSQLAHSQPARAPTYHLLSAVPCKLKLRLEAKLNQLKAHQHQANMFHLICVPKLAIVAVVATVPQVQLYHQPQSISTVIDQTNLNQT